MFGARLRREAGTFAGLAVLALSALLALNAAAASTGLTFTVNSTSDRVDSSPGNGVCRTSAGTCTLRAAIQEANAHAGADFVNVPAGTYALAIPPTNENTITTGDLDITGDLTIAGAGAASTFIDGGVPPAGSPPAVRGLDRLFEIHAPATAVSFSDVTIRDGYAADHGGAIHNNANASLSVTRSVLTGNYAVKTGGGIQNHLAGTVTVSASTISGNAANESGSALNNNRDGTLHVTDSSVSDNSSAAVGGDPGLVGAGAIGNNAELDARGTIVISSSTIADNASGATGGAAISNDGAGTVTVDRTSFARNRAGVNGGAIFNGAGALTVTDSSFLDGSADNGGAIYVSGAGSSVVVERSSFSRNTATARGGAIYNGSTGELTVTDSTFTGNSAADWGGALVNADKGSVTIATSSFTENSGLSGGGFANDGSGVVTIAQSIFLRNTAPAGAGGGVHINSVGEVSVLGGTFSGNWAADGGGLSNEGNGTVTVSGTRFANNAASQEGGGVLVQAGNLTLQNIEVVDNVANSAVAGGGGISLQGDKSVSAGESVTIVDSRILRNRAAETGGGIDSRGDGDLGITGTTIESNTARIGGGMNHVGDAPLGIVRSTLARNHADQGGGLFTDGDGETTLENSTISANTAAQFGGGLLVRSRLAAHSTTVTGNSAPLGGGIDDGGGELGNDGVVSLQNTIVAGNAPGGNCSGTVASLGGNIDSGDTCRFRDLTDQPVTDPLLGPLADNGGPTETHALAAGSPAQDAAVETPTELCPPTDQRGIARPHGARCDVGAFESELAPAPPNAEFCSGRVERAALADSDAWLSQSAPNNNFGTDSVLTLRSQIGSSNARALVRFLLPNAPAGCELVGATLRLHASAAAAERTLQAFRVGSSWNETDVAWSNQPATTGAAAATESGLGYREWDVLEQTSAMYESGNWGFLIRDAAENSTGAQQSFHSREKGPATPPELVLVFDGERPPTTSCTDPSELTASAGADSGVLQSSAASNYGSDAVIKVVSKSGGNSRLLVRFGLPAIPTGCRVIEATLRLHASSAQEGRTLQALRLIAPWSETAVTWSNQPATGGAAASAASGLPAEYVEWSVLAQVSSMYTEGNFGFLLRDAAESSLGAEQSFHSREKGIDQPPELVLRLGDLAPPETTIDSGPSAMTTSTAASFTFSSSKPESSFACALDGAAFAPCAPPTEYTGLADGPHTFQVRATDRLGDVEPTPASYAWTIDTTAPETTIDSGPPNPTNSRSAAFSLASTAGSSFECRLDGGAFLACSSAPVYSDLGEGAHTFQARASDPLGNVDPSPASYSWTVDVTAPETTIDSGPEPTTQRTSANFTFAASEPDSAFECSLDGAAYEGCTSPAGRTGLAVGAHEFRVRATDAAGNLDASPASYSWEIEPQSDTTPPETTIDSGPSGTTTDTSANFVFSASEPGSSFTCSLDGSIFAACTSPRSYAAIAVGNHEFRVRAEDAAGNVDTTSAIRAWTVATTCVASTSTLAANADAWVLQSSSTSNYGADSAIKVDSKAGANARVLVRFNLPATPAGCKMTSARLRLYAASFQPGRTLQALYVTAPWTESAVTWSNQPSASGTAATVASDSGYREWVVTSQVQKMYADSNHGFLVRDAVEGGSGVEQTFNSREDGTSNPPRLVLTFG